MRQKLKSLAQNSLFFKILLIFILGHVIFSSVSFFSRHFVLEKFLFPRLRANSVRYANLIVDRFSSPLDTTKVRRFSEILDVQIAIQNDTLNWASKPGIPNFDLTELPEYEKLPGTRVGFHKGLHVQLQRGNTKFFISLEPPSENIHYYEDIRSVLIFVFFSFTIFVIYKLVQRVLRPISDLHEGVRKVSRGDLNYEIKLERRDELGQLVRSFNQMRAQIQKMIHAREQLLLDVSHELRSPLTRAKVALEFLEDSPVKENIREDIVEINTMITEILETERLKSEHGGLKLTAVDLEELLQSVVSAFQERPPGVVLTSKSIEIYADPARLRLLFRNLIENALKYSSSSEKPVEIRISDENGIKVEMIDYGLGIPEEELPFIFEPFYRVDKSRSKQTGGYGLGMHLCKNIMDAHGGKIEITSKVNQGTTVTLYFNPQNPLR